MIEKKYILCLVIAAATFILSRDIHAGTYYVLGSGSNSNGGSSW